MSKIAIITDTHFGARGDLVALHRNMQKFYDTVFFPTLDKYGVKEVLHGGDYTDKRQNMDYGTARFVHEHYRKHLRTRDIHEHVLVGNHDAYLKHTNDINSIEEMYRHDTDDVTVIKNPCEYHVAGEPFLLLPWICNDNREDSLRLIRESSCAVVLGHLELQGFQMYRGQPSETGLDPALFNRFELVMSGHFHHKSTHGPIHYLGAPYPMIWSDYRDPRGFHMFDTRTHELEFIENPYSIFVRLIYDDEGKKFDYIEDLITQITGTESPYRDSYIKIVVRTKTQPYWFDLLMDSLYKVNALDVVIVDDIIVNDDDSETVKPDEELKTVDTLGLMSEYVAGLSINCDKAELNAYLREIYCEAVDAEQSGRLS